MFIENDGVHIASAIERTQCSKHKVPQGVPCHTIQKNVGGGFGRYAAICGTRIKAAGFNGKISPQSMRTKAPFKKVFEDNRPAFARAKNPRFADK